MRIEGEIYNVPPGVVVRGRQFEISCSLEIGAVLNGGTNPRANDRADQRVVAEQLSSIAGRDCRDVTRLRMAEGDLQPSILGFIPDLQTIPRRVFGFEVPHELE